MAELEPKDILAKIEEALSSPKVDVRMLHQFNFIRERMENFDPDKIKVPFLARVKNDKVELEGILTRIGTIYGMLSSYSAIPDIVENPDVFSLEASISFPMPSPSEGF